MCELMLVPFGATFVYTHVRDYTIHLVLSIVQTCEIFTLDMGHQMRPNEVNSNQYGATQHDYYTQRMDKQRDMASEPMA